MTVIGISWQDTSGTLELHAYWGALAVWLRLKKVKSRAPDNPLTTVFLELGWSLQAGAGLCWSCLGQLRLSKAFNATLRIELELINSPKQHINKLPSTSSTWLSETSFGL